MVTGWLYRGTAAGGTLLLALGAGLLGNSVSGTSQSPTLLSVALICGLVGVVLAPLYTPRPRSVPTVLTRTATRLGVACFTLLVLNGIGLTAAPELLTTAVTGVLLVLTLPVWYLVCRRDSGDQRVLVLGEDPTRLRTTIRSLPTTPVGFLSPVLTTHSSETESTEKEAADSKAAIATDGGVQPDTQIRTIAGTDRINGLSRFPSVLTKYDIDSVALAFDENSRTQHFEILQICHTHGVNVLVHDSFADYVLTTDTVGEHLTQVDLKPWPWYSRVTKRLFDLVFAVGALMVATPLLVIIAVAIKLDSPGPILYGQTRRARLGGTFPVWKFRSMLPESEDANPGCSQDRITSVGRILRKTHLDEIPQLLSILTGEMSVVGPRPVWTEEEELLQDEIESWSKRWAVTPGLTGLAQVRNVDSTNGQAKLESDLEYIRRQSIGFDLYLVAVQLWQVMTDCYEMVAEQDSKNDSSPQANEQTD
ncbi:sugar transferase [Natronococcus sp. JC468]|nr:sugar transferase [Natronococcus sp. JC468]